MTDQADLERGYRRLLAWYPRAFRRENGREILAVLMACAPDGQRRPGLAESADLVKSGLRMRLRPGAPRSAPTVRAAFWLMYAGAVVSTVNLINSTYLITVQASIDDNKIHHLTLPELTGAIQVQPIQPLAVTASVVSGLAVTGLWLWMARSAGQRRNWARVVAAALFALATLEITLVLAAPRLISLTGNPGGWLPALVTWPVGAAAVGLLWCPASTAFFKPRHVAPARPPGFPPGPASPGDDSAPMSRP
jgi:hypothetical protein